MLMPQSGPCTGADRASDLALLGSNACTDLCASRLCINKPSNLFTGCRKGTVPVVQPSQEAQAVEVWRWTSNSPLWSCHLRPSTMLICNLLGIRLQVISRHPSQVLVNYHSLTHETSFLTRRAFTYRTLFVQWTAVMQWMGRCLHLSCSSQTRRAVLDRTCRSCTLHSHWTLPWRP